MQQNLYRITGEWIDERHEMVEYYFFSIGKVDRLVEMARSVIQKYIDGDERNAFIIQDIEIKVSESRYSFSLEAFEGLEIDFLSKMAEKVDWKMSDMRFAIRGRCLRDDFCGIIGHATIFQEFNIV